MLNLRDKSSPLNFTHFAMFSAPQDFGCIVTIAYLAFVASPPIDSI